MPAEIIHEFPLTSPDQARACLAGAIPFEVRYLHALNTVEERIATHFRGVSFEVGFARPPLGGGDGWLDEAMVPHVCDAAEAAGWLTSIDGNFITFTAPAEADDE